METGSEYDRGDSRPWHEHPVVAMAAGCLVARGFIAALSKAWGNTFEVWGLFAMVVFGPAIPGLLVGALVRRHGARWAGLAALVFSLTWAGIMSVSVSDVGALFFVPASLPAVGVAAWFGSLGEVVAGKGKRALYVSAVVWVLVALISTVGMWLIKSAYPRFLGVPFD